MNKNELENIYSLESKKMLAYIRKSLNKGIENFDEMDILQDTFYSLINGAELLKPIDNLTSYVYKSIRNRIIDMFRKKKLDIDDYILLDEIVVDDLVTDQIEQEELLEFIYTAIEQLPSHQREVFIKTEIKEMTFQEIADDTGVSINTLLSQKRYAIKKLKELLTNN